MHKKNLLLFDGHNVFIRSFIGLMRHDLRSPDGDGTWGVFGAINTIASLVRKYQPTHVMVAFDSGRSAKRLAIDPEYKANRNRDKDKPKSPTDEIFSEEFKPQLKDFKLLCTLMGVPFLSIHGTEADDIIASIALSTHEVFDRVIIVSADHDLQQLIRNNIIVVKPGISYRDINTEVYDHEAVVNEWGVTPERLPEIWALMGDKGDNIKGIKGIGPKKAMKLIAENGDLESVLSLDDPKIAENIGVVRTAYSLIKLGYDDSLALPPLGNLQFNPVGPKDPTAKEVDDALKILGFEQVRKHWLSGTLWQDASNFGRSLR